MRSLIVSWKKFAMPFVTGVEVTELNRHIEALSKQLVRLDSQPANDTAEKPVVQEKLAVEKEVVAKSGFMQRLFKSDRAKTSSSAPIVEGISVEQALVDLLEHLDVPNSLEDRAMVLREQIKAGHIKDDWESLLDDITELINAMHCQMRDDQEDLEIFLSEVSQRLQEVDAHMRGSAQSEDQGKDNRSRNGYQLYAVKSRKSAVVCVTQQILTS